MAKIISFDHFIPTLLEGKVTASMLSPIARYATRWRNQTGMNAVNIA
jgi:hypothetical protein